MDKAPFEMLCEYFGWDYGIAGPIAIVSIIALSVLFEYLINKKEK